MHPGIVADVDDCRQLVIAGECRAGGKLAKTEQPLDAKQKAGAADSADQNRDLHTARQYARPRAARTVMVGGCERHAKAATAAVSQKIGHEMVWKSSE